MEFGLRLRVVIRLLGASEGGRTTPVRDGYRPLCEVAGEDGATTAIGMCQLEMDGELAPGSAREASLAFSPDVSDLMRSLVAVGSSFDLVEPPHVVGRATVQGIE